MKPFPSRNNWALGTEQAFHQYQYSLFLSILASKAGLQYLTTAIQSYWDDCRDSGFNSYCYQEFLHHRLSGLDGRSHQSKLRIHSVLILVKIHPFCMTSSLLSLCPTMLLFGQAIGKLADWVPQD